jgi:hypothetical protein
MPILADRGSTGKLAWGWPCCILRVFVARGLWREAKGIWIGQPREAFGSEEGDNHVPGDVLQV